MGTRIRCRAIPTLEPYLLRALNGEVVTETLSKRPDPHAVGEERTTLISYYPARDEANEVIGVSVAVLDITDRQRAEQELRKSQAQLHAVMDAVPVGVIIADGPEGKLTMVNPAVQHIYAEPVMPGPDLSSYADWTARHPDGTLMRSEDYPLARAILHGEVNRQEMIRPKGDGTDAVVDVIGVPVRGDNGKVLGSIAIVQDVSTARRMRSSLLQIVGDLTKLLDSHDHGVKA